ncbi:MAG: hypothetical protein F6K58_14785 [Symploca sp. SIO2E9]|nr:hypothetical protein [Symploca sp. SIO2E9]
MANYKYVIHPAIGVARVGNHPTEFFLAPNEIGGLPLECDQQTGDEGDQPQPVTSFKAGIELGTLPIFNRELIKRQGQKFRVYKYNTEDPSSDPEEVNLDSDDVTSIKWTVHLANKKAVWYEFSELKGNLLLGEENSYAKQGVPFRNQQIREREHLIIDPGPRIIEGAEKNVAIDNQNLDTYPGFNFPDPKKAPWSEIYRGKAQGQVFKKLGDLKTDSKGNLIVLGGHGKSWGLTDLAGYGGGDYWFDDISDGSVTCDIILQDGTKIETLKLKAWVIVGPPDFAPEITNISAWDDTAFDVAVRKLSLVPDLYNSETFQDSFVPNYERDILPIINRISRYHWVANVQSMTAFSSNIFDFSKPWENKNISQAYFGYFREPNAPDSDNTSTDFTQPRQVNLFSNQSEDGTGNTTGIPLMPLNSSSNSIKNINIEKFLALTETQYFLLEKWFNLTAEPTPNGYKYPLSDKDRASIGNVVGLPQAPGIEVTWTTQNQAIYEEKVDCQIIADTLYQIRIKHSSDAPLTSLTPDRDETNPNDQNYGTGGCEPGDLTKRMAIPWQADFYNCSIQLINYTDPNLNKVLDEDANLVPERPTYYAYWWPPQAPWNVINGLNLLPEENPNFPWLVSREKVQRDSFDAEMAGLQMNFARGMNSYSQIVNKGWASLGFIRNTNVNSGGELADYAQEFPYFVETERNYDDFYYKEVTYQEITGNEADQDGVFVITTLDKPHKLKERQIGRIREVQQAIADAKDKGLTRFQMAGQTEETPISQEYEASLQQALEDIESFREIKVTRQKREIPRSGRRIRF